MKLDKKIFMWIILMICVVIHVVAIFACIGLFFGGLIGYFGYLGWTGGEWINAMVAAFVAAGISGFGVWFLDGVL